MDETVPKLSLDLIQASPFFEAFAHEDLIRLAQHARPQDIAANTVMLRSGQPADILYMLVVGKVELLVEAAGDPSDPDSPCTLGVPLRTIGEPGRVIGWSAMVEPYHYRATPVAVRAGSYRDHEPPE